MKAATTGLAPRVTLTRISIHAAREGGDVRVCMVSLDELISIHAAREGGDIGDTLAAKIEKISIHAAREGGDAA